MSKYFIYSDGGARGNPGPAAYGYVCLKSKIKNQKSKIFEGLKYIGVATNNQAEYQGVLNALKCLKLKIENLSADRQDLKLKIENIQVECFLDSQLIVEQMNGRYKIKNEGLKPLFWQIRDLIMQLGGRVTFSYIPREQNAEADRLVNLAIDRAVEH